jgi:hypothetical protein
MIAVVNLKSEPIGSLPTHESQVRLLTKLKPKEQREAWKIATEINANRLAGNFPQSVLPSNN